MRDTIYRDEAVEAVEELNEISFYELNEHSKEAFTEIRRALKALPSADRPQGEWLKFGLGRGTRILFCTNCERRIEVPLSQDDLNYDYCPNCGADMRESN